MRPVALLRRRSNTLLKTLRAGPTHLANERRGAYLYESHTANAVRSAACRVFVAMAAPLVLGVSPALPLAGAAEAGDGNANSKQAIVPNSNRPPAAGGSPASELRLQFAPGSIKTAADAQRALDAARATAGAADKTYRADEARCAGVFFVNACRDEARRAHLSVQQEVHRVEVEAHDVQRRTDAEQRAGARAQRELEDAKTQTQPSNRPADPAQAQRDARTAKARGASRARSESAAAHRATEFKQRQEDARKAEAKRVAEAGTDRTQRAANAAALAQKQKEAALYAKRKEADRIENEKRREKRRAEREANNAPATDTPPMPPK